MAEIPKPPQWRPVKARRQAVYKGANEAIENAYKEFKSNLPDTFLLGSSFDRDIFLRLPRGAPNKRFGNFLLDELKGIEQPRRPDIVDFGDRTFFEIKPAATFAWKPQAAVAQLRSLYDTTEAIRIKFGAAEEPEWTPERDVWMPPPVLPMPGNPRQLVVTVLSKIGYSLIKGLIIYQVWEFSKSAKRSNVAAVAITQREKHFATVIPNERTIAEAIQSFDPEDPDYVILIPRILVDALNWDERFVEKYGAKVPPFLDRRNPIGQMRDFGRLGPLTPYAQELGLLAEVLAVSLAIGGAQMLITAGGIVAGEALAGAAAAGGGGAGAGGAQIISLASRRLAAELAKAAAGVLLVVGTVAKADSTGIQFARFDMIRVVPDSRITPYKGTQSAQSDGMAIADSPEVLPTVPEDVALGDTVIFDSQPYVVAAKLTAV